MQKNRTARERAVLKILSKHYDECGGLQYGVGNGDAEQNIKEGPPNGKTRVVNVVFFERIVLFVGDPAVMYA